MSENKESRDLAEALLLDIIEKSPEDWASRKKLAQLLYNEGKTPYAADIIWDAPEIPSIDLELGFAIKILSKGAPRRAIRLLTFLQERNTGKHVQNLGIANALMHYGLVMQAARFYGAAVAGDSQLACPDLEAFLLWVDDTEKLWGDFPENKPDIGALPWMKRDAKEAEQLKKAMKGHTTPIHIPNLQEVTPEKIVHDIYAQSDKLNAKLTPPPSVGIPIGRVNPKDIIYDSEKGAAEPISAEQAAAQKAAELAANPMGSGGESLPESGPAAPLSLNRSNQPTPTLRLDKGGVNQQSLQAAPRPVIHRRR